VADDSSTPPLTRRVPGAARAGPAPSTRRVISDAVLERMQAAVDASQAALQAGVDQDPITEPLPQLQAVLAAEALTKEAELEVAPAPAKGVPPRITTPQQDMAEVRSPAKEIAVWPGPTLKPDRAPTTKPPPFPKTPVTRRPSKPPPAAPPSGTPEPRRAPEPTVTGWPFPAQLATASPTQGRQSRRRARRHGHRGTIAAAALVLVLIIAGSLAAVLLSGTGAKAHNDHAAADRASALQVKIRDEAAAWVAKEVSHAAVVACDPKVFHVLVKDGFPVGNLRVIGSSSSYPKNSTVVVETATVRNQFGSSLDNLYAPGLLASFPSGSNPQIEVRVIAPNGARTYFSHLRADLAIRKAAAAWLLQARGVAVSGSARTQLATGQVDVRLLVDLTDLASHYPIDIVAFGNPGPGVGPGIPRRFADLAADDAAAKKKSSTYVRSIESLLNQATYRPMAVRQALVGHRSVLEIEFAAPSPLGLQSPHSP
jgi:hypothetical protein